MDGQKDGPAARIELAAFRSPIAGDIRHGPSFAVTPRSACTRACGFAGVICMPENVFADLPLHMVHQDGVWSRRFPQTRLFSTDATSLLSTMGSIYQVLNLPPVHMAGQSSVGLYDPWSSTTWAVPESEGCDFIEWIWIPSICDMMGCRTYCIQEQQTACARYALFEYTKIRLTTSIQWGNRSNSTGTLSYIRMGARVRYMSMKN